MADVKNIITDGIGADPGNIAFFILMGLGGAETEEIVVVRPGQGAHKQPIEQTVWIAPKKEILEDPAMDRAFQEVARNLTKDLNQVEVKLSNRQEAIDIQLQQLELLEEQRLIDLEEGRQSLLNQFVRLPQNHP